jgi:hypothetical protein
MDNVRLQKFVQVKSSPARKKNSSFDQMRPDLLQADGLALIVASTFEVEIQVEI